MFKPSQHSTFNMVCNMSYDMFERLAPALSSRPEVFCKIRVLRNFAKFTGKHLRQSLFLIKLQAQAWWLLLYCLKIIVNISFYSALNITVNTALNIAFTFFVCLFAFKPSKNKIDGSGHKIFFEKVTFP